MDWVFEAWPPSWDLTEVDTDEVDVVVMEKNENIEDRLEEWQKHSTVAPVSEAGSSKKARGHGDVSCLVDGCRADLSSCREYHRRHRVCEPHSKTPVVAIRGKYQRFCQQCSRFHSVGEFDQVKRSCRKRLDGHNRRRRKPRGDVSMYLNNNYQTFFTNYQGTKLLRFGGSPATAYAYTGSRISPNKEKSKQQLSSSSLKTREKKFPFLLGTDSDASSVGQRRLPNNININAGAPAPAPALSLLSNNNTSQANFIPPTNYVTGLNLNSSGYTNNNDNHMIGMIHFRTEGLSLMENEAPQVLSFSWGE